MTSRIEKIVLGKEFEKFLGESETSVEENIECFIEALRENRIIGLELTAEYQEKIKDWNDREIADLLYERIRVDKKHLIEFRMPKVENVIKDEENDILTYRSYGFGLAWIFYIYHGDLNEKLEEAIEKFETQQIDEVYQREKLVDSTKETMV